MIPDHVDTEPIQAVKDTTVMPTVKGQAPLVWLDGRVKKALLAIALGAPLAAGVAGIGRQIADDPPPPKELILTDPERPTATPTPTRQPRPVAPPATEEPQVVPTPDPTPTLTDDWSVTPGEDEETPAEPTPTEAPDRRDDDPEGKPEDPPADDPTPEPGETPDDPNLTERLLNLLKELTR